MSLCVAWRWQNTLCLASDSCISIDANNPKNCGIKVLQVPIRVISPIENATGHFDIVFQGTYGLCFAGRFLTAYLVKESISELLFNLQFVGRRADLTFEKLSQVVFSGFSRVLQDLGELDADFILAGCCPSDGKTHAAKFFRDTDTSLKWIEILTERPFSIESMGSGETAFQIVFDEMRKQEQRVHIAVFETMEKVIASGTIPSVSGAIQYGQLEAGGDFRLFGVLDYARSDKQLQVRKMFRGMELETVYEGENLNDLHVHYSFIDPFVKKKERILAELGIHL